MFCLYDLGRLWKSDSMLVTAISSHIGHLASQRLFDDKANIFACLKYIAWGRNRLSLWNYTGDAQGTVKDGND